MLRIERKAARGGWTAGTFPYGYGIDPEAGHLVPRPDEAPLVPRIFELYASHRLGAKAVATELNAAGHRTRSGRPRSHMSVLTILRNRAYVSEVFFRNAHHPAPHEALVDMALFAKAQAILTERGEDYSRRASNPCEYLLAGVVVCHRCGCHYTGTAARGRNARYRSYTCFTCQRYGTSRCDADRLPAGALEDAVIGALQRTYTRRDLLDRAIAANRAGVEAGRPGRQE